MAINLRSVAHIAIKGLLNIHDNINPIIRELRSLGISYRYQNMRRDIREALDWKHNVDASSRFDPTKGLQHDLMVKSWKLRPGSRYRVFGLMTLEDPLTGEKTTRLVSYYTNYNSPEPLQENELQEYLDQRGYDYGREMIAFKRMAVMWNPELGQRDLLDLEEI